MKKGPKKAIPGSGKVGPLIPAGTDRELGIRLDAYCGFCHRSSDVVSLWGTITEESGKLVGGYVCEDCKN